MCPHLCPQTAAFLLSCVRGQIRESRFGAARRPLMWGDSLKAGAPLGGTVFGSPAMTGTSAAPSRSRRRVCWSTWCGAVSSPWPAPDDTPREHTVERCLLTVCVWGDNMSRAVPWNWVNTHFHQTLHLPVALWTGSVGELPVTTGYVPQTQCHTGLWSPASSCSGVWEWPSGSFWF